MDTDTLEWYEDFEKEVSHLDNSQSNWTLDPSYEQVDIIYDSQKIEVQSLSSFDQARIKTDPFQTKNIEYIDEWVKNAMVT